MTLVSLAEQNGQYMDYLRNLKLKDISGKLVNKKRKMAAQGDHFNIKQVIKLNKLSTRKYCREKTSAMTFINY